MKVVRITEEEPQTVEGIIVRATDGFGVTHLELSPNARVVTRLDKGDMYGSAVSSVSVLAYTKNGTIREEVGFPVPDRDFPKVRLTKTRVVEHSENDSGYWTDVFVRTTLEDLEEGNKKEGSLLDYTNSGEVYFRRTLEGRLELLPEKAVAKRLGWENDSGSCTVVGIRSNNGKYLTPVVFYASPSELSIEGAYGHPVRLVEEIWNDWLGGIEFGETFEQKLTDLETGQVYEGSIYEHEIKARKLQGWLAQAKKIQDGYSIEPDF